MDFQSLCESTEKSKGRGRTSSPHGVRISPPHPHAGSAALFTKAQKTTNSYAGDQRTYNPMTVWSQDGHPPAAMSEFGRHAHAGYGGALRLPCSQHPPTPYPSQLGSGACQQRRDTQPGVTNALIPHSHTPPTSNCHSPVHQKPGQSRRLHLFATALKGTAESPVPLQPHLSVRLGE